MNAQDDIIWLKQQLIELQTQVAFQEDTLQALNDVITKQQQQIEYLAEISNYSKARLESLDSEIGGTLSAETKPPHY